TATVNNISGLLVSGTVGGAIGLDKAGAGRLTLTAANTYTGATIVNGGVLQIGDGVTPGASIASSGPVTVNSGGTLTLNLANNETFTNDVTDNNLVILDDAPLSNYTVS